MTYVVRTLDLTIDRTGCLVDCQTDYQTSQPLDQSVSDGSSAVVVPCQMAWDHFVFFPSGTDCKCPFPMALDSWDLATGSAMLEPLARVVAEQLASAVPQAAHPMAH